MANEPLDHELLARLDERTVKLRDELSQVREDVAGLWDIVREMSQDVAVIKTDLGWVKKFFWIVAAAAIATLIKTLFT